MAERRPPEPRPVPWRKQQSRVTLPDPGTGSETVLEASLNVQTPIKGQIRQTQVQTLDPSLSSYGGLRKSLHTPTSVSSSESGLEGEVPAAPAVGGLNRAVVPGAREVLSKGKGTVIYGGPVLCQAHAQQAQSQQGTQASGENQTVALCCLRR